jgi:hypothetical protein
MKTTKTFWVSIIVNGIQAPLMNQKYKQSKCKRAMNLVLSQTRERPTAHKLQESKIQL